MNLTMNGSAFLILQSPALTVAAWMRTTTSLSWGAGLRPSGARKDVRCSRGLGVILQPLLLALSTAKGHPW